ncbi:protein tyrosine phosphatase, partial [Klebsiella pneumoniae]
MSFKKILVVCVGNICRSPIGEALLQQQHPNLTVKSAGLSALVGEGADDKAIQVMDEWNIDIRSHRAQQLT